MNDEDGHRIEAAEQSGFNYRDLDELDGYFCTEAQLIAFAKACERAGRAQSVKIAQTAGNAFLQSNPDNIMPASLLADHIVALNKMNAASDAELAPILEAERVRFLAEYEARK